LQQIDIVNIAIEWSQKQLKECKTIRWHISTVWKEWVDSLYSHRCDDVCKKKHTSTALHTWKRKLMLL
jgi:hypothetical protein